MRSCGVDYSTDSFLEVLHYLSYYVQVVAQLPFTVVFSDECESFVVLHLLEVIEEKREIVRL